MTQSTEPVPGTIRTISSREVYRNPWLSLREDVVERPDGSRGIYSVVDRPDYAVVIAAERDGFHLVDQYRYPIRARHWEFPQGCFPPGRTGTAEDLGRAELAEETGLSATSWTALGTLNGWHGASGQAFTVFLATGLSAGTPRREHEEQDMRHRWVPRPEFERMIRAGSVRDDSTLAAYLLLQLHERTLG
ncbi:NUDIX domain-containing protein [Streptomyces alkaliphilus]|uniref:NUDIX domain-containing protein n=1 Tax=Streptomyces alkaliphilus TaxID=1472722 RepID=A0A7W3T9F7_9ACTN|nr:NUDIX hydrolase [Streptomyces alkaliphilus]MBB0242663.1 NUDIX domain-containing protein [Streptomyces alkaliphilus]